MRFLKNILFLQKLTQNMSELDIIWKQFEVFRKVNEPKTNNKLAATDYYCTCGGEKNFGDEGFPVCTSCGIVDTEYIDHSKCDWASNVDETGKVTDGSRCGAPTDTELFSEQWGASTIIDTRGKSYAVKRIARLNLHMAMNHKDRALYHAYKGMDEIARVRLKLPDSIIRNSKIMYRKFNIEKLTRGAIRKGIKANCVLAACMIEKCARTTKEVADAFNIPTKDISRTSQLFKNIILGETENTITKPVNVCSRILNKFPCEGKRRLISINCQKMCKHVEECVELMSKSPTSVACVVVMKILGITKQNMSEVCHKETSIPTLTKIENIIDKYLEKKPI